MLEILLWLPVSGRAYAPGRQNVLRKTYYVERKT
jgi:hypothetical protein